MGTLGTLLIVGGIAIVAVVGYNMWKGFDSKKGLESPLGEKVLSHAEEVLHGLHKDPPKAVSHAHLGRYVSFN